MTVPAPKSWVYQASRLSSIVLTIVHAGLLFKRQSRIYKNNETLARTLLYLGSAYSGAFLIWTLSSKHDDYFSAEADNGTSTSSLRVTSKANASPRPANRTSRYLGLLAMAIMSETILLIDISWVWYQGVKWAWSLPILTQAGAAFEWSSRLVFPVYALWFTFMWGVGNLFGLMALGQILSIGRDAEVEEVVRWNRPETKHGAPKKLQ